MPEGRILIVDDEPGVRALLWEVLREDGHEVHTASNIEEALETVLQFPPGLALVDIRLKGSSGLETARRLKELNHRMRLVFITATSEDEARKAARGAGADAWLLKPFDIDQLRSLARGLVAHGDRGEF